MDAHTDPSVRQRIEFSKAPWVQMQPVGLFVYKQRRQRIFICETIHIGRMGEIEIYKRKKEALYGYPGK